MRKGATKISDVLFFHQAVVYGSLKTEYAIDQLPGDKRLEHCDRTLYIFRLLKYFISNVPAKLEPGKPQNLRVEQDNSNTNYLFSVAFFCDPPSPPTSIFWNVLCNFIFDLQSTVLMPFFVS